MLRAAVIAIALCGCRDKQVDAVRAVRDEVCACRDVACGEAAMKKVPARENQLTGARPRRLPQVAVAGSMELWRSMPLASSLASPDWS